MTQVVKAHRLVRVPPPYGTILSFHPKAGLQTYYQVDSKRFREIQSHFQSRQSRGGVLSASPSSSAKVFDGIGVCPFSSIKFVCFLGFAGLIPNRSRR